MQRQGSACASWLLRGPMIVGVLLVALCVQATTPSMPPTAAPPPPDTPLQARLPGLRAGIARGDALAMCVLAAALDDCETYGRRLTELQEYLRIAGRAAASRGDRDAAAAFSANNARVRQDLEPNLLGWAKSCAGASDYSRAQRIDLWHDAAQAGNRNALATYGSGAAFHVAFADPLTGLEPQLAAHRAQAETLTLLAARRGDVFAVSALASAYADNESVQQRSLLAQAVQPDRVKAVALYARLARAMDALPQGRSNWLGRHYARFQLQRVREGLTPEAAVRAQALGEEWDKSWAPIDTSAAGLVGYWSNDKVEVATDHCMR